MYTHFLPSLLLKNIAFSSGTISQTVFAALEDVSGNL
jgi:hypothetical protein